MDELKKILEKVMDINFVRAVISNPRTKGEILKIKVRPIEKKDGLYFQFESYTKTQVFHENIPAVKAAERILSYINVFRQMQMTAGGRNILYW